MFSLRGIIESGEGSCDEASLRRSLTPPMRVEWLWISFAILPFLLFLLMAWIWPYCRAKARSLHVEWAGAAGPDPVTRSSVSAFSSAHFLRGNEHSGAIGCVSRSRFPSLPSPLLTFLLSSFFSLFFFFFLLPSFSVCVALPFCAPRFPSISLFFFFYLNAFFSSPSFLSVSPFLYPLFCLF